MFGIFPLVEEIPHQLFLFFFGHRLFMEYYAVKVK